jgi:hypothetical protein
MLGMPIEPSSMLFSEDTSIEIAKDCEDAALKIIAEL